MKNKFSLKLRDFTNDEKLIDKEAKKIEKKAIRFLNVVNTK